MPPLRQDCLDYLVKHYPTWPAPHHGSHAVVSHYGYGWELTATGWVLHNREAKDRIVQADWLAQKTDLSDTTEMEFKFLLPALPAECDSLPALHITQHYLDLTRSRCYLLRPTPQSQAGILTVLPPRGVPLTLYYPAALWPLLEAVLPATDNPDMLCVPDAPSQYSLRLRETRTDTDTTARYTVTLKAATEQDTARAVDIQREFNISLPANSPAIAAWQRDNDHTKIVKSRYCLAVPELEKPWEIDHITHPRTLFLAELEVSDPDAPRPTPPAAWQAVDVSHDPAYKNSALARTQEVS